MRYKNVSQLEINHRHLTTECIRKCQSQQGILHSLYFGVSLFFLDHRIYKYFAFCVGQANDFFSGLQHVLPEINSRVSLHLRRVLKLYGANTL
jgi:hypothetical protein